ncbi:hypothetical protein DXC60_09460 [Bifidobacterium adolescentis]|uniref:hypothetical protein n=1 Tax=Bifidobacterium adolescentis TaxID=1680 RepID=UPI000E43FFE8|nr:hypothetical protein [Bifidobacterium adolescentis]RGL53477.1 hypothetical protein DXC60_09460 [Bifidobacterium adolescentis]
MADTTNRRREPKGIPTGGRFTRGSSGAGDASDLTAPAEDSVLGGVDAVDMGCPADGSNRFYEVKGRDGAKLFASCIGALKDDGNPFAAAVDVHAPEEYERCRMFLTEDGKAGFAIAEGDELVSVFSRPGKHAGGDVVAKAVELGARRLDCYDIQGALPCLYGSHGFKPVAYVDWNDDYAPDGWDYGTLGRPRVLAMAVTDDPPAEPAEHVEYDEAVAMARDVARRS